MKSFVFQMKCQVTSSITRRVMISREVEVATYKAVCGGEKMKVNLGYINLLNVLKVENNELQEYPSYYDYRKRDSHAWEIFSKFFSVHNIEPNWLNCKTAGYYDEDQGVWTGCFGKV